MKWFREAPAQKSPTTAVTWQDVINAGERCTADIDLIERTSLLSPEDKEAQKNDALEVFAAVFNAYIKR